MDRRTQVLFALQDFVDEHDYQPSLRELARLVGLRSVSSVHAHVRALEAEGLIRRGPRGRSRSIELSGGAVGGVPGMSHP